MDKNKAIEILLDEWRSSLKSKDRSYKNVRPNFEELFERWYQIGATFDDLYEWWLPKAIKAHQPSPGIARASYKKLKMVLPHMDKSEKEFIDDWNQSISDTAKQVFFEFFPPPRLDDDDDGPKIHGNMSLKEYLAQRRYAEQFPVLDTTELEERWKNQQYNLDVQDLLKNVLGGSSDEVNS